MAATPAPMRSINVGDIKVTYLPDGEGHFVTSVFPKADDACWARHVEQTADGRWVASIGGFLVESGDQKVLVDLGFGEVELDIPDFATASSGKYMDSLKQTGVQPADVNTVVFTHMHSDHTGWTLTGDNFTFSNARHLAGPGEVAYWSANAEAAFAPVGQLGVADQFDTATDGELLAPGVNILSTSGHTPGHQCVVISSGNERAIILGDMIHCSMQIAEPDVSFMFDVDENLAKKVRDKMVKDLEKDEMLVSACHFSGSVFGRVLRGEGKSYYWSPLT